MLFTNMRRIPDAGIRPRGIFRYSGVIRGLIRDGYPVFEGMKIADIDPRAEQKKNCFTISDKARCIAGGVLEVLLSRGVRP